MFSLPTEDIASATGFNLPQTKRAIQELEDAKFIEYDPEHEAVWVVNAIKFQGVNEKSKIAIRRDFTFCSSEKLKILFFEKWGNQIGISYEKPEVDTHSNGYLVGIDTHLTTTNTDTNTDTGVERGSGGEGEIDTGGGLPLKQPEFEKVTATDKRGKLASYRTFVEIMPVLLFEDSELVGAWREFVFMRCFERQKGKSPPSERAVKMLFEELESIEDRVQRIRAVRKSIASEWLSFYPEKYATAIEIHRNNAGRTHGEKSQYQQRAGFNLADTAADFDALKGDLEAVDRARGRT